MRAELSAALCSPKENPFGLNIEPTKVALDLEGTPSLTAPPFVVDLPTLTVTPLTLTVTPPAITVTPPNITVGLPTVTVTMFVGPSLLPPGALTTITIAPTPLTVTTTPLTVTTTPLTVTTNPVTVSLGSIRVHAAPVTATELPFAVGLDLDETKAEVSFDGLRAALQGCLTLNGGEPPTRPTPPPPPPPPPTAAKAVPRLSEGTTRLDINGEGFGQAQGLGFVEVTDQGGTSSRPTTYDAWADDHVVVRFQPALATGTYAALVTNDAGGRSGPALFTV
jgi:hypothetical protein